MGKSKILVVEMGETTILTECKSQLKDDAEILHATSIEKIPYHLIQNGNIKIVILVCWYAYQIEDLKKLIPEVKKWNENGIEVILGGNCDGYTKQLVEAGMPSKNVVSNFDFISDIYPPVIKVKELLSKI